MCGSLAQARCLAAALGLAAQSALAEAHRREEALLRLRGATEGQLARLAAAQAGLAGLVGSGLGLMAALAAVSAVEGSPAWRGVSTGNLAQAMLAAVALGAGTTGARLLLLVRARRRRSQLSGGSSSAAGGRSGWARSSIWSRWERAL